MGTIRGMLLVFAALHVVAFSMFALIGAAFM